MMSHSSNFRGGYFWFILSPIAQVLPVGGGDVWPRPLSSQCLGKRRRYFKGYLINVIKIKVMPLTLDSC